MATLIIKGFPDVLQRKLQTRAKRKRRSVAQEVIHLLTTALATPHQTLSILELQGLGKAAWDGTNAAGHVARERESWD